MDEELPSSPFDDFETGHITRAGERARNLGIAMMILGGVISLFALDVGGFSSGLETRARVAVGLFYLAPAAIAIASGALYFASGRALRRIVLGEGSDRDNVVSATRNLAAALFVQFGLAVLFSAPILLAMALGIIALLFV